MKMTSDRRCKVIKLTLADVWKQGCIIRINNFGDKEKAPHSEKDIKNQVNIDVLTQHFILTHTNAPIIDRINTIDCFNFLVILLITVIICNKGQTDAMA